MSTNPLLIALGQALPDIRKQIAVEKEKKKQLQMGNELQSIFNSSLAPIEMERKAAGTLSNYGYTEQALKLNKEATKKQSTLNQYEREIKNAAAEKSEERLSKVMIKIAGSAKSTDDLINIYKNLPGDSAKLLSENIPSGIELRTQDGQPLKHVWADHPTMKGKQVATWVDPNDIASPGKYQTGPDGKPMTRDTPRMTTGDYLQRRQGAADIKTGQQTEIAQIKKFMDSPETFMDLPAVKKLESRIEESDSVRALLKSKNPVADQASRTLIRRVFGDVGNATEQEQKLALADPSFKGKWNDFIERVITGKISDKTRAFALQTLDELTRTAETKYELRLDIYKDIIMNETQKSEEEVNRMFEPLQGFAAKLSGRKKQGTKQTKTKKLTPTGQNYDGSKIKMSDGIWYSKKEAMNLIKGK